MYLCRPAQLYSVDLQSCLRRCVVRSCHAHRLLITVLITAATVQFCLLIAFFFKNFLMEHVGRTMWD